MVQIVTSVKSTFVHVEVDSPDCVEMGSNARRRASSTPARVTFEAAVNENHNAYAFEAPGLEEFLLPPHDDDDYTSMHAHPGPSPLDMDVEGMSQQTDLDDDAFWGLCISQAQDETTTDYGNGGMEIDDTLREDMEYYSASYSDHQGLTYGAQSPNANYLERVAQNLPCSSAAPVTPHEPAQRQIFSTFPIPPRAAQRDSYMELYSVTSLARVLQNPQHEETQGEEKRTTVILNNLPLRYASSKLMSTIDSSGFAGMYDFIYVPMSAARSSKGYAFVNWVNPCVAQRFLSAFDGFSRWSTASKNVGHAAFAKQHQGLQTNIDRYRNSTVLGKAVPDEYKPRLFQNGEEVPFPPPTRKPSKPTQRVRRPRENSSQQTLWLGGPPTRRRRE